MSEVRIAPSILTADFSSLGEVCSRLESAGADWLHLDVMDGRFVPNLTFGPLVVEAIRKQTDLFLDAHLMIVEPQQYVEEFVKAGAQGVTVHAEACTHLHRVIYQIKDAGARAGVALNPATPLHAVMPVLRDLDLVLCMTVNPGFGGQSFIPSVLEKVKALEEAVHEQRLSVDIQVDGGIKSTTVAEAARAGARVFVAGSAVISAEDWGAAIAELRRNAEEAAAPIGFRGGQTGA